MLRALALGLPLAVGAARLSAADLCRSPDSCTSLVIRTQDPRVGEALAGITDSGARLVALRSYLRAGSQLAQRWSWTQAQIETFAGSAHEQALQAAIEQVRGSFERQNPGYTLSVSPQVRSLDRQLAAWNRNSSVAAAAREFQAAAARAIQQAGPAGMPVPVFARFVADHKPEPQPTLAAPGLSRHGRMYAVDFHVRRGASPVADTDSATISTVWNTQGWEQKLRAAVVASGAPFTGPLEDPHEPWHYDYEPPGTLPEAAAQP
jgi:hypothetical protein